jgi:hypothetical protein
MIGYDGEMRHGRSNPVSVLIVRSLRKNSPGMAGMYNGGFDGITPECGRGF